jgi:predicted ArsR family transcriptional regulator
MSAQTIAENTLTDRQLAIAVYLHRYLLLNDNLPTAVEVAKAFGIWPNAAHEHLVSLTKKGLLEASENRLKLRFSRTSIGLKQHQRVIEKSISQGGPREVHTT